MKLYLFLLLSIGVYAWAELPDSVTDKPVNTNLEYLDAKTNKAQKDINTVLNRASAISANGYSYFPNGVLMQWGSSSVNSLDGQSGSINFTIPFPTSAFNISITCAANKPTGQNWSATGVTTVKFDYTVGNYANAGNCDTIFWQAIGH